MSHEKYPTKSSAFDISFEEDRPKVKMPERLRTRAIPKPITQQMLAEKQETAEKRRKVTNNKNDIYIIYNIRETLHLSLVNYLTTYRRFATFSNNLNYI